MNEGAGGPGAHAVGVSRRRTNSPRTTWTSEPATRPARETVAAARLIRPPAGPPPGKCL